MAVDIYVNPPRVDVFHGTPRLHGVSFGNKTIWGGSRWVDDSPTRSDIEKRDKGNHSVQNDAQRAAEENENKRTEAAKRLSDCCKRKKDENTLKTLRAGNADAADIKNPGEWIEAVEGSRQKYNEEIPDIILS